MKKFRTQNLRGHAEDGVAACGGTVEYHGVGRGICYRETGITISLPAGSEKYFILGPWVIELRPECWEEFGIPGRSFWPGIRLSEKAGV